MATGDEHDERLNFPNLARIGFTLAMPHNMGSTTIRSESFLGMFRELKHRIIDINFTCRVPPFTTDAYAVCMDPMKAQVHLKDMLYFQEQTGITVSALFNNIYVPPIKDTLEQFVENFRPLYEMGVRSATIPHVIWMKWGKIRKEYPELQIKTTVLRDVRSGQDFWNMALAGFDYVNLHRVVSRDRRALKEVKRVQTKFREDYGKHVVISILDREGCRGSCPFWVEHYQHILQHPGAEDFDERMFAFDVPMLCECMKLGINQDESFKWNSSNLSPFKEDLDELAGYVDVIKIGDRLHRSHLSGTLRHVRRVIDDNFNNSEELETLDANTRELVERWRTTIKTCRFQCWGCSLCSDMELVNDRYFGF